MGQGENGPTALRRSRLRVRQPSLFVCRLPPSSALSVSSVVNPSEHLTTEDTESAEKSSEGSLSISRGLAVRIKRFGVRDFDERTENVYENKG